MIIFYLLHLQYFVQFLNRLLRTNGFLGIGQIVQSLRIQGTKVVPKIVKLWEDMMLSKAYKTKNYGCLGIWQIVQSLRIDRVKSGLRFSFLLLLVHVFNDMPFLCYVYVWFFFTMILNALCQLTKSILLCFIILDMCTGVEKYLSWSQSKQHELHVRNVFKDVRRSEDSTRLLGGPGVNTYN